VDTKNSVINNSSETQIIENFGTISPNVQRSVFSQAFIIEAINLGNLSRFVVSSNQGDSVGESDLRKVRKAVEFNLLSKPRAKEKFQHY